MFNPFRADAAGFLSDILDRLGESRRLLSGARAPATPDLAQLADLLLSRRGQAAGVALSALLASSYEAATGDERRAFLTRLARDFGPDPRQAQEAVQAYLDGKEAALDALHQATEPRRQEVFRRLNLAPGGTRTLLRMRVDLLDALRECPELAPVDADFLHLFASWFNRGFLELRRIDWDTPAAVLDRIIQHEAVHEIDDWDDLRNRLQPADRRCYGFFHPQLPGEPLIFVEVALTAGMPAAIAPLLDIARQPAAPETATTAVFYSISNTQRGLGGVTFGNFLIKQVVALLRAEFPQLTDFVTLSPVPGFARWLAGELATSGGLLPAPLREVLRPSEPSSPEAQPALLSAAALYFLQARDPRGRVVDSVARFHLGNGASLWRLNPRGDLSANGLRQSHGLMVNYRYSLDSIEANHEAFAERGEVATSPAVRDLLPAPSHRG